MNDDELRAALARRASSQLSPDERNDLLRSSRLAAVQPRPRSWAPRLASSLVGAVAVVVLALIALPILLSPPTQVARTSASALPQMTPAANLTVHIYSAQELAGLVQGGSSIGRTVVSDAAIAGHTGHAPECSFGKPCYVGTLRDDDQIAVWADWRDTLPGQGSPVDGDGGTRWLQLVSMPTAPSPVAYRIEQDRLVLLGPVKFANQQQPWQADILNRSAGQTATDDVYVASGWLVQTGLISCPAPAALMATPQPALDWYCGGSWLTASPHRSIQPISSNETQTQISFDDGVHSQNGAYDQFALDPSTDGQGSVPRYGVYLMRDAGCQPETMGDCPVWRIVGRLDDQPAAPAPSLSPSASPSPISTTQPSGNPITYTAQQLSDMVGDPQWVGKDVLAQAKIIPVSSPCDSAAPVCTAFGQLDAVSGTTTVTFGWRDATAADGVRYDDGNGYRWITPLELPTTPRVFAFAIGQAGVEYLGPARTAADGSPLAVADVPPSSQPSDDVYIVNGWLTHTMEAPCAFPQQGLQSPMPDISSYYCGGAWLTDEPPTQPVSGLTIDGGLHVQGDAYSTFAVDPQPADGGGYQPRQGVYLIRNAGCPEVVTGDCPVWRVVGRLDGGAGEQPTPAPTSSDPRFYVSNTTTLSLIVAVDGQDVGAAPPGKISDFDPSPYVQPWDVTIATVSGRRLLELTYSAVDVWTTDSESKGVGKRLDLSCGRLDVYAGPPMLGPGPPESFPPNDCEP